MSELILGKDSISLVFSALVAAKLVENLSTKRVFNSLQTKTFCKQQTFVLAPVCVYVSQDSLSKSGDMLTPLQGYPVGPKLRLNGFFIINSVLTISVCNGLKQSDVVSPTVKSFRSAIENRSFANELVLFQVCTLVLM